MKKILLLVSIISVSSFFVWEFFIDQPPQEEIIYIPVSNQEEIVKENPDDEIKLDENNDEGNLENPETSAENEENLDKPEVELDETDEDIANEEIQVTIPGSMKLEVMFSTQAPTEDWGMPYQEACEEASLIMTYYYFADKYLDRSIMNQEILDLVDWEMDKFSYFKDTNLAETELIAQQYFNLETEITSDVTVENIKYQISQGNLLIVPFAGRMLENPYFSGEGPLYHMLVVKGYDHKNFITNDPGLLTLGEDFEYSYENLLESVHDWNGGNVNAGRKVMLIVKGLKE